MSDAEASDEERGEKEELKREYKSRTRITGDEVIPGMENLGKGQDTTDTSWRAFSDEELDKLVRHGIISQEWCIRYKAQLYAAQKTEVVQHKTEAAVVEEEEVRGGKELKRDYKSRTRITGDEVVPGMESLGKGQDKTDENSWRVFDEQELEKLARHGIISPEWVARFKAQLQSKMKPLDRAESEEDEITEED